MVASSSRGTWGWLVLGAVSLFAGASLQEVLRCVPLDATFILAGCESAAFSIRHARWLRGVDGLGLPISSLGLAMLNFGVWAPLVPRRLAAIPVLVSIAGGAFIAVDRWLLPSVMAREDVVLLFERTYHEGIPLPAVVLALVAALLFVIGAAGRLVRVLSGLRRRDMAAPP